MQKLLKAAEVAKVLDVTEGRVYQLIRQRMIPFVHLGRQVRVDEAKLRKWIEDGGQELPGGWKKD